MKSIGLYYYIGPLLFGLFAGILFISLTCLVDKKKCKFVIKLVLAIFAFILLRAALAYIFDLPVIADYLNKLDPAGAVVSSLLFLIGIIICGGLIVRFLYQLSKTGAARLVIGRTSTPMAALAALPFALPFINVCAQLGGLVAGGGVDIQDLIITIFICFLFFVCLLYGLNKERFTDNGVSSGLIFLPWKDIQSFAMIDRGANMELIFRGKHGWPFGLYRPDIRMIVPLEKLDAVNSILDEFILDRGVAAGANLST